MTKKEFGIELRILRKNKGMRIVEIAKALGMNFQDISAIERGARGTSLEKKNKILKIFNAEYQEVGKIIKKIEK